MDLIQSYYENFLKEYTPWTNLTPGQSLFAMFLICYASKFVHVTLSVVLLQNYDNVNATFKSQKTENWQSRTVTRAYNAHQNHFEALLGFSVAVLLAITSGVNSEEFVKLCNWFIAIRVMYNAAYIVAFNEPLSMIRSSFFTYGVIIIGRIFVLAITVEH